jgi:membrane protease YdiL (CAAX protease family)
VILFGKMTDGHSLPLPSTRLQLFAFLPLALTAGTCEEIVFRGYLLQQFTTLTSSRFAATLVQAALFSFAHGFNQPFAGLVQKFLLGLLFAAVVHRRRSLIPAMVAHVLLDVTGAVLAAILG